jgi:hypothetical protein
MKEYTSEKEWVSLKELGLGCWKD